LTLRRHSIALAAVVTLTACGSSTAPSPTPTGISIISPQGAVPDGVLFLGHFYLFTMKAVISDGSTLTTGGTWGSDAPSVATLGAVPGMFHIVGIGEATIFVDFQGQRATRRIRTNVRYQGRLLSQFQVTGCVQTGDWARLDACGKETPSGTLLIFEATFTQAEETVTAIMDLGDLPAPPVTAILSRSGELRLQSSHHADNGFNAIVDWLFRPYGLLEVDGTMVGRARANGVKGYWELRGKLLPARIVGGGGAAGPRPRGRRLRDALGLIAARAQQ
jgi:hypothetical protein